MGLGVAEFVTGVYAISFGDVIGAIAIAVFYLGFTIFVVNALVRDLPLGSCGCFGRQDTPPNRAHAVVAGLGVVAGVLAIFTPPGPANDLAERSDPPFLMFLLATGIALVFFYAVMTRWPWISRHKDGATHR